jgi:hypothetical protein
VKATIALTRDDRLEPADPTTAPGEVRGVAGTRRLAPATAGLAAMVTAVPVTAVRVLAAVRVERVVVRTGAAVLLAQVMVRVGAAALLARVMVRVGAATRLGPPAVHLEGTPVVVMTAAVPARDLPTSRRTASASPGRSCPRVPRPMPSTPTCAAICGACRRSEPSR